MPEGEFAGNGEGAYGRERGGVNVEHAQGVHVMGNRFSRNACGVRFWWDADEALAKTPWAQANGTEQQGGESEDLAPEHVSHRRWR